MPDSRTPQAEREDSKGRIALVTGGNRGIGLEVCRRLAALGMRVVLGARDEERGNTAKEALREEGLDVAMIQLDVDEPASIEQARRHIAQGYSRLDVLVNNAAVNLDEDVSVFDLDEARLERTLRTNFWGPFRTCRAFIPLMMSRGYGRVVNVSSGSGSLADMTGTTAAYRVSKTALNALTRIFAAEVYMANVKVNSVCPGWVQTAMGGPFAGRAVEDAAETIVWLATLNRRGPTAGFFRDRRPIPW
jgi:NAD(P)-dependent dehydrogenase (short-subunit alcohol dehydrogenase family)